MSGRAEVTTSNGAVGSFAITRDDKHVLSLSSYNHGCIEFDADGNTVKDHGWVFNAEAFLTIATEFLKGGWQKYPLAQAEAKGYQVWAKKMTGGLPFFQILHVNAPAPSGDGGRPNLGYLLIVKGIR